MKYICKCKNNSEITYKNFKKGVRCRKCSGSEKHIYKDVKINFEEQGCKLLESIYVNNKTKMKYICKCGNISYTIYNSFIRGVRCDKCSGSEKLTYKFVKNYFEKEGCKLLETEYFNSQTKMKYICSCGDEHSIRFHSFQYGSRCNDCGNEKSIKSSKQFKDYMLPSGKNIRIQGYENLTLDILLKNIKKMILLHKEDICQL